MVFSYFADTINYLEEKLKGKVVSEKDSAFVSTKIGRMLMIMPRGFRQDQRFILSKMAKLS